MYESQAHDSIIHYFVNFCSLAVLQKYLPDNSELEAIIKYKSLNLSLDIFFKSWIIINSI